MIFGAKNLKVIIGQIKQLVVVEGRVPLQEGVEYQRKHSQAETGLKIKRAAKRGRGRSISGENGRPWLNIRGLSKEENKRGFHVIGPSRSWMLESV